MIRESSMFTDYIEATCRTRKIVTKKHETTALYERWLLFLILNYSLGASDAPSLVSVSSFCSSVPGWRFSSFICARLKVNNVGTMASEQEKNNKSSG